MPNEFKPGDLVQLKSGGPAMTVRSIGNDGDVFCVWYCTNTFKYEKYGFEAATLEPFAVT